MLSFRGFAFGFHIYWGIGWFDGGFWGGRGTLFICCRTGYFDAVSSGYFDAATNRPGGGACWPRLSVPVTLMFPSITITKELMSYFDAVTKVKDFAFLLRFAS
jgi:hypothetical protein